MSLGKIKFHCMDHDGGSIFVSPVDKEILQAQKKVGRKEGRLDLTGVSLEIKPGETSPRSPLERRRRCCVRGPGGGWRDGGLQAAAGTLASGDRVLEHTMVS